MSYDLFIMLPAAGAQVCRADVVAGLDRLAELEVAEIHDLGDPEGAVDQGHYAAVSIGLRRSDLADAPRLFAGLKKFCRENGLALVDSWNGEWIDLDAGDELPPGLR